jgi:TPR repeat protein
MTWYAKAAIQRYPRAMFHIGLFYDAGNGVAKDPQKARSYIEKAAQAGDPEAAKWLADHK